MKTYEYIEVHLLMNVNVKLGCIVYCYTQIQNNESKTN